MNKRDFVLSGCTALAANVVLPSPAMAGPASIARALGRLDRLPDLQRKMSMDTWRKYVGERFVQTASGGAIEMVLARVDAYQTGESAEQFSLTFAATKNDAALPSEAHHLRHGTSGQQFPIYLQAAGTDSSGSAVYRAEFNRLV